MTLMRNSNLMELDYVGVEPHYNYDYQMNRSPDKVDIVKIPIYFLNSMLLSFNPDIVKFS